MWEVAIWLLIFGGFFLLRGILATFLFFYLLPDGDRCPHCDAVTLKLEPRRWSLLGPKFRRSWCLDCGWHGLLKNGELTPQSAPSELTRKLE